MIRLLFVLLGTLFPILAFAVEDSASTLSFAPPPSDYSVMFLGNIFGVVDGVLHGTGSQIMGAMFSVFNSAVLALGGIVIMYTLLVSTLNTAHEGQMLGQKWSSIWVPVRSTLGLALLIPKASGYCLMQIFVMWVVLQGIGAADKVWNAALGYLNRGGVIVQEQIDPIDTMLGNGSAIAKGAGAILTGQVCMIALQAVLTNQRDGYLKMKQSGAGPCAGNPSPVMNDFCNTAVPDFVSSVNVLNIQSEQEGIDSAPDAARNGGNADVTFTANMPNIESGPYAFLNGICGSIVWNKFDKDDIGKIKDHINSITKSELDLAKMSRAIAINQMYSTLLSYAQIIVNNDPQINPPTGNQNIEPFSKTATQQFGVPYLSSGVPCDEPNSQCMLWGSDPSSKSSPIFSGTEFLGAVQDYDGVMMPTLNLIKQAGDSKKANEDRLFIDQASSSGWLMAGSYFTHMAALTKSDSKSGANNPNLIDSDSGLDGSSWDIQVDDAFSNNKGCQGDFENLCTWLQAEVSLVRHIKSLINGADELDSPLPQPDFKAHKLKAVSGKGSSTTYGFIDNSAMIQLPNEQGIVKPQKFKMNIKITFSQDQFSLPSVKYGCGKIAILFFSFCLAELLGELFYNGIIVHVFNFFLHMVGDVINYVMMVFLSLPLQGMAEIFKKAVKIIEQPDVNPVIALANMGVYYINFASELWIFMIELAILSMMIPLFGIFIMPLIGMVMPLLLAWLGTMVAIGFVTAYYIPFLPYMIFTFGSIGWLMAVIEAMVAAPIVALGVTHPEGEGPFGKGEQAIMILMNVFLRPAMMIIGYIAAIALSYVAIWIISAGFANVSDFLTGDASTTVTGGGKDQSAKKLAEAAKKLDLAGGYTGWAGIYAFFFAILVYTSMYVTVVQKSFGLITMLPDKVLRWIGGQPESIGGEAAAWADEDKKQVSEAGEKTAKASKEVSKQEEQVVSGALASATEAAPEVSGS